MSSTTINAQQGSYGQAALLGLQDKHVYGGTVADAVVADRRAKNRQARKSRRINRRK